MRCCSGKTAAPPGCFTQRATRPARLNPIEALSQTLALRRARAAFFSGAAWAYWNDLVSSLGDFEMSAKAWAMKIHGAAAMAILVLVGMLLTGHVGFAWTSWIHLAVGLALPLLLILHIWLGKRTRPAAQLQKRPPSVAKIDIA